MFNVFKTPVQAS